MPMIRVAFVLSDVGWTGGVNYYKNLLLAIKENPDSKVCPILFFDPNYNTADFESLGEIIKSPLFAKYSLAWLGSKLMKKLGRDYLTLHLLQKHHIDVLSHVGWLWKKSPIPTLGWIPDFQHIHLDHFFADKEIDRRNKELDQILVKNTAILLSSQDALDDLKTYSGTTDDRSYVLKFRSCISFEASIDEKKLKEKYQIERPWFYIPNQFWQHKNHLIVLEALAYLKEEMGVCPLVLCSGETKDYRNSDYFPELLRKVDALKLEKDFVILGKVPYTDVVSLMSYSMGVVNPSLFEGWNTAVEEAKAMGKVVVLSDIAVHKEQNPERGCYFVSNDSKSLAEAMRKVIDTFDESEECKQQENAKCNRSENMIAFAKEYESIIIDLLGGST